MTSCRHWIITACVVVLALMLLLPLFGVSVLGASLLLISLVVGCCVIPMLVTGLPHRSDDPAGCCESDRPAPSQGQDGGKKGLSKPGCH